MHAYRKVIKFAKEGKTPGYLRIEFWVEEAKIFFRHLDEDKSGIIRLYELKHRMNELYKMYRRTLVREPGAEKNPQVIDLRRTLSEMQELVRVASWGLDLTNPEHRKHAIASLPIIKPTTVQTSEVRVPFFYQEAR